MHTTLFKVPAGTRINMTILGYDGCTPLRNPFWGQVTGTIGDVALRERQAGLSRSTPGRAAIVGHTFSIPAINLNVPMASPRR